MINSFILFRWFIAAQCIRRNILIRIEFISCAANIESKYKTRPNMFSDHSFLVKSYICRCNDEIVVNLTRPLKSGSIFWVDLIICSVLYWILYRFNKEIISFNFYHWLLPKIPRLDLLIPRLDFISVFPFTVSYN